MGNSQSSLIEEIQGTANSNGREVNSNRKIKFNKVHVNNCTFKGGVSELVHRWFRLTPSFGPDLVQKALCKMNYSSGGAVLDPFSGAGTTAIECQLHDIKAFGIEINPVLYFVCKTSLEWSIDHSRLKYLSSKIKERHNQECKYFSADFDENHESIPKIHNPFRWWNKPVLRDIIVLKKIISEESANEQEKNFFMLALANVLVPDLSNVTLGKLQLHFIDRSKDFIDTHQIYFAHLDKMLQDITQLNTFNTTNMANVFPGDATETIPELVNAKISFVLTSPPYPNRYSYVWNTRPHLYMLDFFSTPKEASSLDIQTIGGTWGTATSILGKGVLPAEFDAVDKAVTPTVELIRKEDNLMANYVMKYFNKLAKQIVTMNDYLAPKSSIAYVVGCSRIKGVYVETDVILSKIIESLGLGFKLNEIDRFRKRHSGIDLYESVVYCSRS